MTYIQPFFPLLLLGTVASLLFARWRRVRWIGLVFGVLLVLYTIPMAAWLPLHLLEGGYCTQPPRDHSGEAIVVLSSGVFPPDPPLPTTILGADTYARCAYAAWLYEHWQTLPILASGGGSRGGAPYSLTMADALRERGVPPAAIWKEEQSRSTYENALLSAAILRQRGISKIVLVTHAYHMARAAACFRKQGISVIPAPCSFRSNEVVAQELWPTWEAVAWNEESLHEGIGLAWYKLRGRI